MTSLTGTTRLIRFILRRDRVRLSVWVLAIALSMLGSVASFAETYPTAADRQTRAEVLDNPAGQLFIGPGYGSDNYTYGAMTANEMLPLTAAAVALMSVFLVVRHTRAEEENGRAELVRAAPVGRLAPLTATLTVVVGAQLVLAALLTIGLPASLEGLSTTGSVAFSAALAGVGVVFAGLASVAAQLTVAARGAIGIASMVMGGAYLVRSVGDMNDTAALTWVSPFGWATEIERTSTSGGGRCSCRSHSPPGQLRARWQSTDNGTSGQESSPSVRVRRRPRARSAAPSAWPCDCSERPSLGGASRSSYWVSSMVESPRRPPVSTRTSTRSRTIWSASARPTPPTNTLP
jgi:hypothetical protein